MPMTSMRRQPVAAQVHAKVIPKDCDWETSGHLILPVRWSCDKKRKYIWGNFEIIINWIDSAETQWQHSVPVTHLILGSFVKRTQQNVRVYFDPTVEIFTIREIVQGELVVLDVKHFFDFSE
jgi:hypothetical protein